MKLLSLAPRGASGLKFHSWCTYPACCGSRPARGEWIEIFHASDCMICAFSLAPRGASGLKSHRPRGQFCSLSLAPRGASGLKSKNQTNKFGGYGLAPRGASGLKSVLLAHEIPHAFASRPARGEWIEIQQAAIFNNGQSSRPARGEWIEIIPPCIT